MKTVGFIKNQLFVVMIAALCLFKILNIVLTYGGRYLDL